MFGGAILIHQTEDDNLPVVMRNNVYKKNMAYFSGNAVYSRGIKTMLAQNETYEQNYGLSKGLGSALHIKGLKKLEPISDPPGEETEFD